MPALEIVATDERKRMVFGGIYKTALSNSIDKAKDVRAKPNWDWQKKEGFKAKLTDLVDQYKLSEREVGEGMLVISKNPGAAFEVMKLPWKGDTREIANQFLAIFKPKVEKIDPNIEVTIEMKGNWITVWAKNKQTPQPKVAEKPVVAEVTSFDYSDEAGGEKIEGQPEEKPAKGNSGGKADKKPAAQ